MKWMILATPEEYNAMNAIIERALGLPNEYFAGYAPDPRMISGKYYLPITQTAMLVLTANEINSLVGEIPVEIEEE